MAENEDENIIKKAEEDKGDIKIRRRESAYYEIRRKTFEKQKNLREAGKMVDTNEKPSDIMAPENIAEHEPTVVNRDQDTPEKVEKRIGGTTIPGILARKPILIILIIGAIVLGGFLVYSQIQLSNQSYKVENYNALWNQSLVDLRGGNASIVEYCNSPVHDEDLCNRFMNLQYID